MNSIRSLALLPFKSQGNTYILILFVLNESMHSQIWYGWNCMNNSLDGFVLSKLCSGADIFSSFFSWRKTKNNPGQWDNNDYFNGVACNNFWAGNSYPYIRRWFDHSKVFSRIKADFIFLCNYDFDRQEMKCGCKSNHNGSHNWNLDTKNLQRIHVEKFSRSHPQNRFDIPSFNNNNQSQFYNRQTCSINMSLVSFQETVGSVIQLRKNF